MPGFVSHYIFGREAFHKLPHSSLRKNLYHNRAAYGLGLQGPDFFFYFLPSYVLHGHNPGSVAHTTDTQKFYRALVESRSQFHQPAEQRIAEAYLIGFLGHYTLDTICHPFIYGRTHYPGYQSKDYFSRHAYLETDIDTDLLACKLNLHPSEFYNAGTIALTFQQQKVIAAMLCYAYRQTYPNLWINRPLMFTAIYSLQVGLHILRDRTGQKKVLFRTAEKHFLGYPVFSPLIQNDHLFFRTDPMNMRHRPWTNPWDPSLTSTESFFDLYEKAEKIYFRRIKKLTAYLQCKSSDVEQKKLLERFLEDYGNYSFHSGLDASIPS